MTPQQRAAALAAVERLERGGYRNAFEDLFPEEDVAAIRTALTDGLLREALREARRAETAAWEAYSRGELSGAEAEAASAATDAAREAAVLETLS